MALYVTVKDTKLKVGDEVALTTLYLDGDKTKKQVFKGIVIAIKGAGKNKSFTVRKVGDSGIGVERIFPVAWPWLEKVVVIKKNKVKRAKLYYLRGKIGREAMQT